MTICPQMDILGLQPLRAGNMANTFYDPVLHIPLIIKHPNLQSKRISGLASRIDLTPTILSFLGLNADFRMGGKNLTPLIVNSGQVNTEIFAGTIFRPNNLSPYFEKEQVAVIRDSHWKIIAGTIFRKSKDPETTMELYDVLNDPKELNNLIGTKDDVSKNLKAKLQKWLTRMGVYQIK